jgi:hypothetical protein
MSRHDYLEDKAANYRLMQQIREWWKKRGHNVRVWLEKEKDPQGGGSIYVVKTNIQQNVENLRSGYSTD